MWGSDTTNPKKESLLIWYRYERSKPIKTLPMPAQSKMQILNIKANKNRSMNEKRLCPQQTRISAPSSELSWAGTVVVIVDFG